MKKRKLNLSLKLNKQVVSKLDEKKIVGGSGTCLSDEPDCPWSDWMCFKTDAPWNPCQTAGGPSICGGIN